MKILFIAGNGRSGSTLLNVILGQVEGFFAVGELRRIWDRGILENRPCGCGVRFHDCPVWNEIFQLAYKTNINPNEMIFYREKYTQTKHLAGMFLDRDKKNHPEKRKFIDTLGHLYNAIANHSGCRVIVDASKWPMYARYVEQIPGVDLYILHLTRDPRASAFSWSRSKEYEPGVHLPKQSALKSTAYWLAWNPSIRHFWDRTGRNYRLLSYEEFVQDPQSVLSGILNFVNEPGPTTFLHGTSVIVRPTHSVAGNITRLEQGSIQIRPDEEWRTAMSKGSRRMVSILTFPWLRKYGYAGPSHRNT